MKFRSILLVATAGLAACATPSDRITSAPTSPSAATAPASALPTGSAPTQASEDARLLALVDAAFDEAIARSPEALTSLGMKRDYGRLDNYTDAHRLGDLELAEAHLARIKADVDYEALSPEGQLTYDLFEREVERDRRNFEWRWHNFIFSTNGSPRARFRPF